MAHKTLTGIVISTKMVGSVTVEVTRKTPHPLYRKLITRSKKYIADSRGMKVVEGQEVTLVETRKMAGNKHFAVKGDNK